MQIAIPRQDYLIKKPSALYSPRIAKMDQQTIIEDPNYPPLQRLQISLAGVANLIHDLNSSQAGGRAKGTHGRTSPLIDCHYRQSLTTR